MLGQIVYCGSVIYYLMTFKLYFFSFFGIIALGDVGICIYAHIVLLKNGGKENMVSTVVYLFSAVAILVSGFLIRRNFVNLRECNEGTEEMKDLAGIIRAGAQTFLKREYRVIIPTVTLFAILYTLCTETFAGVALLFGAMLNVVAVEVGMRAGTYGNVRTTNTARVTKSLSRTLRTALLSGSVSGFIVPAMGLGGFLVVFLLSTRSGFDVLGHGLLFQNTCSALAMRLGCYSLGFSLVAMFNRVAGGNYTKAADISADIVGKNVHNLPEDDSRMPNTVADFIGDCVNDIAGNISDLAESFVATPTACILISMQLFKDQPMAMVAACLFPFILSAGGLVSSLISVSYVLFANRGRKEIIYENGERKEVESSRKISDPGKELNLATYLSAIAVFAIGLIGAKLVFDVKVDFHIFKLGWISPWVASLFGVISSVAVGKITEYYTGTTYKPVKNLTKMAFEGEPFVVTEGDAIGYRSVFSPVLVICLSMWLAYKICGTYGIAIAGLGMLSFVGTTVSIDAFGPVADNAGGIAESCHLDPEVREITDRLDAVGNTTAAIGKGNAIGSATFATVSLIMSYIGSYNSAATDSTTKIVSVLVGCIIGMALVMYFSAMLTHNTIIAAQAMADEGERQLKIPGVIEGTVKPDYDRVIKMAADGALRHMLLPSILALISPILFGFLLGPDVVLGLLGGSTCTAVGLAIYNGNSGGAFDNSKKSIEIRKASLSEDVDDSTREILDRAHKASVVGDTVGDTRKDVVGVALDIFIKTMSTVSNTLAPLFSLFHLL